jgi:hypothetical protein
MVAVAVRLVDLRNMHDAVTIVSALHNPAVARLRRTTADAGETVNAAFQVRFELVGRFCFSSIVKRLTTLIRPPYQNLRKKVASFAESQEQESAYLPPLEVLLQDMQKLDEIEADFVPHPEHGDLLLGNVWKTNLLGAWIVKFNDGFVRRCYDFESEELTSRAQTVAALATTLPNRYDSDTLWKMSLKLEQSAVN